MINIKEELKKLSAEEKTKMVQMLKESGENFNVYPLSYEQERMWYLYRIDASNPYYNVTFGIKIAGELDTIVLERAIECLLNKHSVLRTTIISIDGENFQIVNALDEFSLQVLDLCDDLNNEQSLDEIIRKEYLKPFILEEEIPIRLKLVKMKQNEAVLLVNIHHMFCDGWSMGIFSNELIKIYECILGNECIEYDKQVQYYEYAIYEKTLNQSENIDYWKKRLNNANFFTSLPNSYPKCLEDDNEAVEWMCTLPNKEKIADFCKKNSLSVYSFFVGIYSLVLNLYSLEHNITIGTPVLNRNDEKWGDVIGFFANTIPLNIHVPNYDKVVAYFESVHNTVIDAIDHSELQFDELVNCLGIRREQNNNPIFQSTFTLQNDTLFRINCEYGIDTELITKKSDVKLQFDLMVNVSELVNEYRLEIAGKKSMFSQKRIENIAKVFFDLADYIINNQECDINNIPYIKPSDDLEDEEILQIEKKISNKILDIMDDIIDCKVIFCGNICYLFYVSLSEMDFSEIDKLLKENYSVIVIACKVQEIPIGNKGEILDNCLTIYHSTYQIVNNARKNELVESFYLHLPDESKTTKNYEIKLINPDENLFENEVSKKDENITNFDKNDNLSLLDGGKPFDFSKRTLLDIWKEMDETKKKEVITCIRYNGERSAFTYEILYEKAKIVAANLMNRYQCKNENIVLLISNIVEFIPIFWGCVLAGAVVTPLGVPVDMDFRPDGAVGKRILDVLNIAEPICVIVGDEEKNNIKKLSLSSEFILSSEKLKNDNKFTYSRPSIDEEDTCLLMFTSGSTGYPKGVPLKHRNILGRSYGFIDYYQLQNEDRLLNWMPMDHVGGILMYHICGVVNYSYQVQVETNYILKDPINWLKCIDEFSITNTWAPNFAYGLVLDYKDKVQNLDVSLESLKYICNGGEAINYNACREFMELLADKKLSPHAMIPCWGMTETSSGVLYSNCFGDIIYKNSVAVGKPIKGTRVRIVNESKQLLPKGQIGELEVSGVSTLCGYYMREDLNTEIFSEDEWFDTGDQAVIINDEVIITGRSKELIIKNGLNTSCLEVEKCIEEIDCIQTGTVGCSVIKDEETNQDKVCIFYGEVDVSSREIVKEKISFQLTKNYGFSYDYLVPVKIDDIPRTSIGKIDKKKLIDMLQKKEIFSYDINNSNSIPDWFVNTRLQEEKIEILSKKCQMQIGIYCNCDNESMANDIAINLGDGVEISKINLDSNKINQKIDLAIVYINEQSSNIAEEFGKQAEYISKIVHDLDEKGKLMILMSKNDSTQPLIQGLCCSIPQEYPYVQVSLVSFNKFEDIKGNVQQEIEQFVVSEKKYDYVLYDRNIRYIEVIESLDLEGKPIIREAFHSNGVYVVIGGMGGIGTKLCNRLLERYHCKLYIIGRKSNSDCDDMLNKLRKNGQVEYISCCINKRGDLLDILNGAMSKEHTINGIINMLGAESSVEHMNNADKYSISNFDKDTVAFSAMPRIVTLMDIDEFTQNKENIDVIIFNSATAVYGGQTYSVYSGVSKFIFEYSWKKQNNNYFNFAWSKWDNIGMSYGESLNDKLIAQNAGYYLIDIKKGFASLEGLIKREIKSAIVGVDYINPSLEMHRTSVHKEIPFEKRKVQVFYRCNEDITIIDEGVYGIRQNRQGEEKRGSIELSFGEKRMKAIWEKVLGCQNVSVTEGFFQLGGTSIKIITLLDCINNEFGVELTIVDLFSHPSIRELVNYMGIKEKTDDECQMITV